MAAPKGNQYAVGNSGGRPREYDYEKEAQDLLEWSKKPDALCLYEFLHDKPYVAAQLADFSSSSEVFSLTLKKAKERISLHRANACNKGEMNYGVWNRSARLYDSLVKALEDQDKDADIERKLKVAAAQPINPFMQKLIDIDGKTEELVGRNSD